MLNTAEYRGSRHECRGTLGTLVRGLLDADIENQPTRFDGEPSFFSLSAQSFSVFGFLLCVLRSGSCRQ